MPASTLLACCTRTSYNQTQQQTDNLLPLHGKNRPDPNHHRTNSIMPIRSNAMAELNIPSERIELLKTSPGNETVRVRASEHKRGVVWRDREMRECSGGRSQRTGSIRIEKAIVRSRRLFLGLVFNSNHLPGKGIAGEVYLAKLICIIAWVSGSLISFAPLQLYRQALPIWSADAPPGLYNLPLQSAPLTSRGLQHRRTATSSNLSATAANRVQAAVTDKPRRLLIRAAMQATVAATAEPRHLTVDLAVRLDAGCDFRRCPSSSSWQLQTAATNESDRQKHLLLESAKTCCDLELHITLVLDQATTGDLLTVART
uniref:Uncharacterized protein n=1 Tax=Oryza punctata TaxID=4537 RepID=A0A0E0KSK8_ORYPU